MDIPYTCSEDSNPLTKSNWNSSCSEDKYYQTVSEVPNMYDEVNDESCKNFRISWAEPPVEIHQENTTDIDLPVLVWHGYEIIPKLLSVCNTGRTITVNGQWTNGRPYVEGGPLNGKYMFSQIHFHCPSEHEIDGRRFPLEMHVVHYKTSYLTQERAMHEKDGTLVLVYLFQVTDTAHTVLSEITKKSVSLEKSSARIEIDKIPLCSLMQPFYSNYYVYWGSVTMKKNSYILQWIINCNYSNVTKEEVDALLSVMSTSMVTKGPKMKPQNSIIYRVGEDYHLPSQTTTGVAQTEQSGFNVSNHSAQLISTESFYNQNQTTICPHTPPCSQQRQFQPCYNNYAGPTPSCLTQTLALGCSSHANEIRCSHLSAQDSSPPTCQASSQSQYFSQYQYSHQTQNSCDSPPPTCRPSSQSQYVSQYQYQAPSQNLCDTCGGIEAEIVLPKHPCKCKPKLRKVCSSCGGSKSVESWCKRKWNQCKSKCSLFKTSSCSSAESLKRCSRKKKCIKKKCPRKNSSDSSCNEKKSDTKLNDRQQKPILKLNVKEKQTESEKKLCVQISAPDNNNKVELEKKNELEMRHLNKCRSHVCKKKHKMGTESEEEQCEKLLALPFDQKPEAPREMLCKTQHKISHEILCETSRKIPNENFPEDPNRVQCKVQCKVSEEVTCETPREGRRGVVREGPEESQSDIRHGVRQQLGPDSPLDTRYGDRREVSTETPRDGRYNGRREVSIDPPFEVRRSGRHEVSPKTSSEFGRCGRREASPKASSRVPCNGRRAVSPKTSCEARRGIRRECPPDPTCENRRGVRREESPRAPCEGRHGFRREESPKAPCEGRHGGRREASCKVSSEIRRNVQCEVSGAPPGDVRHPGRREMSPDSSCEVQHSLRREVSSDPSCEVQHSIRREVSSDPSCEVQHSVRREVSCDSHCEVACGGFCEARQKVPREKQHEGPCEEPKEHPGQPSVVKNESPPESPCEMQCDITCKVSCKASVNTDSKELLCKDSKESPQAPSYEPDDELSEHSCASRCSCTTRTKVCARKWRKLRTKIKRSKKKSKDKSPNSSTTSEPPQKKSDKENECGIENKTGPEQKTENEMKSEKKNVTRDEYDAEKERRPERRSITENDKQTSTENWEKSEVKEAKSRRKSKFRLCKQRDRSRNSSTSIRGRERKDMEDSPGNDRKRRKKRRIDEDEEKDEEKENEKMEDIGIGEKKDPRKGVGKNERSESKNEVTTLFLKVPDHANNQWNILLPPANMDKYLSDSDAMASDDKRDSEEEELGKDLKLENKVLTLANERSQGADPSNPFKTKELCFQMHHSFQTAKGSSNDPSSKYICQEYNVTILYDRNILQEYKGTFEPSELTLGSCEKLNLVPKYQNADDLQVQVQECMIKKQSLNKFFINSKFLLKGLDTSDVFSGLAKAQKRGVTNNEQDCLDAQTQCSHTKTDLNGRYSPERKTTFVQTDIPHSSYGRKIKRILCKKLDFKTDNVQTGAQKPENVKAPVKCKTRILQTASEPNMSRLPKKSRPDRFINLHQTKHSSRNSNKSGIVNKSSEKLNCKIKLIKNSTKSLEPSEDDCYSQYSQTKDVGKNNMDAAKKNTIYFMYDKIDKDPLTGKKIFLGRFRTKNDLKIMKAQKISSKSDDASSVGSRILSNNSSSGSRSLTPGCSSIGKNSRKFEEGCFDMTDFKYQNAKLIASILKWFQEDGKNFDILADIMGIDKNSRPKSFGMPFAPEKTSKIISANPIMRNKSTMCTSLSVLSADAQSKYNPENFKNSGSDGVIVVPVEAESWSKIEVVLIDHSNDKKAIKMSKKYIPAFLQNDT